MRVRTAALLTALVVAGAAAAWRFGGSVTAPEPPEPAATATGRAPPPAGPATRADAPWGELTGRVSDLDGRGVADALVVAQDLRGFGGLARSDADGAYRIELMPCARVEPRWPDRGWPDARTPQSEVEVVVAATAAGFTRSNSRRLLARRGEVARVPPIALYRGGGIRGRVVDPSGREVAARVRVLGVVSRDTIEGAQALPAPFPAEFVTSAPGEGFALDAVGPGTVELWATAPGIGTAHGTVEVTEGGTVRVDLPVRVELHIAGQVVDEGGAPVPGCRVVCTPDGVRTDGRTPKVRTTKPESGASAEVAPGASPLAGRPLATDADAEGRFWFYGLRDGAAHTVALSGATADAPRAAVSGVRPGTGDLVLVAPTRRDVTGTVLDDATGAPVAGAGLRLLSRAQSALLRLTRPLGLDDAGRDGPATAEDGGFRLPQVFAGEYVLHVTRRGYEVAEVAVTVGAGPRPRLEVRLVPAAAIECVVTGPDGRAVAGARVTVAPAPPADTTRAPSQRAGPWSGRVSRTTDAAGTCRIEGLPADADLVLRANDADGRTSRSALRLARSERRRADVRLTDPATLVVRVHPATSGTAAGHPVRLRGIDDPDVEVVVETGADGAARVTHVPPGRYQVLVVDPEEDAARPDVAARIATVDLASGTASAHDVSVPDVTVVRGTVRVGGAPVRAARVGFGPTAGTADHFRPLLFEARDGVYTGRVPPGRYHVHVAYPGRRHEVPDPVDVPAAAEQVLDWDIPAK